MCKYIFIPRKGTIGQKFVNDRVGDGRVMTEIRISD